MGTNSASARARALSMAASSIRAYCSGESVKPINEGASSATDGFSGTVHGAAAEPVPDCTHGQLHALASGSWSTGMGGVGGDSHRKEQPPC